jgi:3-keto-5-aminohexanoate cleavage enzyme
MHDDAVIVQAAVTGSIATAERNPNLPMSPSAIVQSALAAWRAGAAMLHIHARTVDGMPTQDVELFTEIMAGLNEAQCDAVINLSTGSAGGRSSGPERYGCLALKPEMASFDAGSTNFGTWVFENSRPFLADMAREFTARGVKPEIECFDTSHIVTALALRDEGLLSDPMHFQLVLGVPGGAQAKLEQVAYMHSLLPSDATWSICGIGRSQLPMNLIALAAGAHLRTGLEDNLYYAHGQPAKGNAQLVERVVRLAQEVGRPVASPADTRRLLNLAH